MLQEAIEERDQNNKHKWMLDPNSKFKTTWDIGLITLVLYTALAIPFNIGFMTDSDDAICVEAVDAGQLPPDTCHPTSLTSFDILVDFAFWVDIVLSFRTGYAKDVLTMEMEPGLVARRYLTGWFAIDFVAVLSGFPIYDAVKAISGSENSNVLALKLFKLPRLLRISRLTKRFEGTASGTYMKVLQIISAYLILNHWIGCLLYFVSRLQVENASNEGYEDTGYFPWIMEDFGATDRTADPALSAEYFDICVQKMPKSLNPVNFDRINGIQTGIEWSLYCADVTTKYSFALYFAFTTMTTVGYGDISPTTNLEMTIILFVQLLGSLSAALIFAYMAVLIKSFDMAAKRLQDKLQKIDEFIEFHGVSKSMAAKVRESIEYWHQLHYGLDIDKELGDLPEAIRIEAVSYIQQGCIEKCGLFQGCDNAFWQSVTIKMSPISFLEEDIIAETGSAEKEMYLIFKGHVDLIHETTQVTFATLSDGNFFGEMSMCEMTRKWYTVRATTNCHFYRITQEDMNEIFIDFPEYARSVRGKAYDSNMSRVQQCETVCNVTLDQSAYIVDDGTGQRSLSFAGSQGGETGSLSSQAHELTAEEIAQDLNNKIMELHMFAATRKLPQRLKDKISKVLRVWKNLSRVLSTKVKILDEDSRNLLLFLREVEDKL